MAEKKKKQTKNYNDLSLREAKIELQKTQLLVRSAQESDTSKIKKLKKHIARLLTKEKNNEQSK